MQIKNILLAVILIAFIGTLKAKGADSTSYRLSIGVSLGTDIGGAVPFPLSNIPKPFNPYPQIKAGLGGVLNFSLTKRWSAGAEVNYKNIGMKADARVKNQKFNMDGTDVYFTGSTKMSMNFTILEVPLYAKYHFNKRNDRIIAGIYYSYTFTSSFEAIPQKGFIGNEPNMVEIMDVSGMVMNFDEVLDSWDMGFLIGYERRVLERLNFGLRFSMGLKDIFKPSSDYFDYNMLPMRGSISFSYNLIKTNPLFKKRKGIIPSHIYFTR